MFRNQRFRLLPVIALAAAAAAAYSQSSNDTVPIGGSHSPDRPVLRDRTPPVDPIAVDPIGGRIHDPAGAPDPVGQRVPPAPFASFSRGSYGFDRTWIGGRDRSPGDPIFRRPTPPIDPINVDPIGGNHQPGQPEPVRRVPPRGRGMSTTLDGVDTTPIGGRDRSPGDPIFRRPTPPVDPINVDPIGGNHQPGQPEPVRRVPPRGRGMSSTIDGFDTTPIGGRDRSPGDPIFRRPTPPVDPINVDPIGGNHQPGQPEPVRRVPPRGRGMSTTVDGFDTTPIGGRNQSPGDPIYRRPTPPVDPINVDPIGGNHLPGQPEPVRRVPPRGRGMSTTLDGFDTTPIGGRDRSPGDPIFRRPTPPVDPINVDPIGGNHQPGQAEPVRRVPPRGRGMSITVDGFDTTPIGGRNQSPGDPILRRPTPPIDPIHVDPIGGNHLPGQPEPIRRVPPRGRSASVAGVGLTPIGGGHSPGDPILLEDGGMFAFEPAVQFSISHPMGAAVADLNGDGRAEIAVTSSGPDRVTILQNLGDGNFGRPIDVLLPDGSGPDQIVAGDFDGDGRLDLCVSLRNMDAVALLANERVFAGLPKIVSAGVQPSWLATGDFDADGYLDLVVSNTGSGNITFLFNDGYADFKSQDFGVGVGPRALAVADFDGDALLDVAVAVAGTHSIEVLRNLGDGVLKNGWTISTGRFVPEGLIASDLEGDGDVDLCITAAGADVDTMLTYLNAGFGAFDAGPVMEMEGTGNSGLAAGDFDLDHNFDLACVAASESVVSVWHNLGMARFPSYDEFVAGRAPVQVVAADLDGNESPDLVIVNRDADSITILINMVNGIAGAPFCFGDGSGTACPARNDGDPGHGCDNAAGTGGALLYTSGAAHLANDTLTLQANNLPRSTLIVFLQGTSTLDRGLGVPFSKGLACLDGNVIVLGVRAPAQGDVQYPSFGENKVSVMGQVPPSGGTRYYQVWYRDNFPPMTYQAYNFSNGVSVNWIP